MKGAFIPLDTLDCDLNNDGRPDKATPTPYVRKFDIDFDGAVGVNDITYVNSQMNQLLDLENIRAGLFTGEVVQLTWPDRWTAQIRAVVPATIKKFVGTKMTYGWLHGTRYPYSATKGFYECHQYSTDLALAAYKALGYGVILSASGNAGGGISHAYNVCFLGGDWKNIENWRLVEPQDGFIYDPTVGKTNAMYNTDTIYFYGNVDASGYIAAHTLHVDPSGVVSFGNSTTMSFAGLLESIPDYFDLYLGMEGGDELNLDQKARTFAKLHPTKDGGTWHLWCAALMVRMLIAYGKVPSFPFPATAKIAGDLAGTLNPDATKAPIGAFHYWTAGSDGHVGLDTKGGGTDVFMASAFISESLGNAIGFQSVSTYTRNGAYPYRGWSMNYGKQGKITKEAPVAIPTPVVTPAPKPISAAEQKLIDLKIIDPGHDANGVISWGAMEWTIFRLLTALGK
jgi:hypothetical protein